MTVMIAPATTRNRIEALSMALPANGARMPWTMPSMVMLKMRSPRGAPKSSTHSVTHSVNELTVKPNRMAWNATPTARTLQP